LTSARELARIWEQMPVSNVLFQLIRGIFRQGRLGLVLGGVACFGASPLFAATVWTGPLFTFSQPAPMPTQATNQDRITTNVWLTRASSKGLFNAASETNATTLSPAGTEWAFGALTNYASLAFTNWLGLLNGQSPTTLVGQQMVAHLTADDIYISIIFSFWGSGNSGGFAYERSTPPPLTLSGSSINGGQFTFSYEADEGLAYVIESSSNLVDWTPLQTNVPTGGTAQFSGPINPTGTSFYRVGLSANP
jgi:hypothetical protein